MLAQVLGGAGGGRGGQGAPAVGVDGVQPGAVAMPGEVVVQASFPGQGPVRCAPLLKSWQRVAGRHENKSLETYSAVDLIEVSCFRRNNKLLLPRGQHVGFGGGKYGAPPTCG